MNKFIIVAVSLLMHLTSLAQPPNTVLILIDDLG